MPDNPPAHERFRRKQVSNGSWISTCQRCLQTLPRPMKEEHLLAAIESVHVCHPLDLARLRISREGS